MPMGHGHWGLPWLGFGWIVPPLGLVVLFLTPFLCVRRMGARCGCGGRHKGGGSSEFEALPREVQTLRDEIRW
jgi:hypothetical protein